jgi:phospholipid/cholesterol/gamma-HCH transport system substrate-binding protein
MYDYIKQLRWAKLKVGIVITIALLVIFITVMFAGSIGRLFMPRTDIFADFSDIKGLREGAPVWFSGVEIGSVKSIYFTPKETIKVTLSISSDTIKYLKKDSTAGIFTQGLLGDKYVEITPGSKESEHLKPHDTIIGVTRTDIQDVVQTGEKSIASVTNFIDMLEDILTTIEKGEGTVSKLLNDPSLYNNLKSTTRELSRVVKKIESGKGSLGKLVTEDNLYMDLSASVQDVKLFADSLRQSEGTVHKLIEDPVLYNRFLSASENLDDFSKRLVQSKGTVHRLIEDESLYENINAASEKLASLLETIEHGEGLVGSLLTDDEISRELKITIRELNTLISDIKENPSHYFRFSLF